MSVGASAPCDLLAWDSDFFSRRIARVRSPRLGAGEAARTASWCDANGIDCAYLLAAADDAETAQSAQAVGFRFVDVRMTLERSLALGSAAPGEPASEILDRAREEDLNALRAIAEVAHRTSRFFADHGFPRQRASALYGAWIEKSVRDEAGAVFVTRRGRQATGYVTCEVGGLEEGTIGLIGVADAERGRGLGSELLRAALAWFSDRHVATVRVATQGNNVGALRLYARHGFVVHSVGVWFHRWRTP